MTPNGNFCNDRSVSIKFKHSMNKTENVWSRNKLLRLIISLEIRENIPGYYNIFEEIFLCKCYVLFVADTPIKFGLLKQAYKIFQVILPLLRLFFKAEGILYCVELLRNT